VVLGIFFWALDAQLFTNSGVLTLTPRSPPFLGIPLSPIVLWSTGPAILLLLVLINLGAGRAYREAQGHLLLQPGSVSEPFDTAPNAIDLLVHTNETSPRLLSAILAFTYAAFLSIFIIEATLLLLRVQKYSWALAGGPLLVVLAYVLLVPTVILTLGYWWSRVIAVTSSERPIHAATVALARAVSNDTSQLAALLSPNFHVLSDKPALPSSKDALNAALTSLRSGNDVALTLSVATVIKDTSSAHLTGRFTFVLTPTAGKPSRHTGVFVAILELKKVQWLLEQVAIRRDH